MFEHPIFPHMGFAFFDNPDSYVFALENNLRNYLLEVTIAVLVDLGGMYPNKLPEWSRKKWEEVKHEF